MNDSDGVHGHEGFGQSDGESDQLLAHERPVGSYVLVEVALCYVLGREIWLIRLQVGVDVSGSTDTAHSLARLNLPSKAGSESRVVGQLGAQQLQRHLPTSAVLGQVDDPHAAHITTNAIDTDDLGI